LKWAYIEAAHAAIYRSSPWRAWFDAYTHGGRQNRNRGYIGVARRLCPLSYVFWKKEEDYRETLVPRPLTCDGGRCPPAAGCDAERRSQVKGRGAAVVLVR
jgi:hypothetical protein